MLAGSVAAGLLVMWTSPLRADTPSEECRDGAAHCREAYDKLDRCQRGKDTKAAADTDGGPDAAPKTKGEACAAEKAGADAACKMTNESCVRDGSGRTPPPHKD